MTKGRLTCSTQLQPVLPPFDLTADHATVQFSQTKLTVDPGQSTTITATFTAPAIDPKGYPAYSGHIEVVGPSETLRVSYLGVLGSVYEQQLLDRSDVPFNVSLPFTELPDGNIQNTTANYTFVNGDSPTIIFGCVALAVAFTANNENTELVV